VKVMSEVATALVVPSLYSPHLASDVGEDTFTTQDQSVLPAQRRTRRQHGTASNSRFLVNTSLEIHGLLPQPKTALFVPSPEAAANLLSSCATGEDVLVYGGFEGYTVALGWQLASTGIHSSVAVDLTGHKMHPPMPLRYHWKLQRATEHKRTASLRCFVGKNPLRRWSIDHISDCMARHGSPN
jgi:hypothetical protein